MELLWSTKKNKKFKSLYFSTQRKAWVQRYNNRADLAETDRGKDAGWKKSFGSQAKEPADHIADWQKKTEHSEIQALEKGGPFFCNYLPLETVLTDPLQPLLSA